MIKQVVIFLTCLLLMVSFAVVVLTILGVNAWPLILAYWIVLTVKNICDIVTRGEDEE